MDSASAALRPMSSRPTAIPVPPRSSSASSSQSDSPASSIFSGSASPPARFQATTLNRYPQEATAPIAEGGALRPIASFGGAEYGTPRQRHIGSPRTADSPTGATYSLPSAAQPRARPPSPSTYGNPAKVTRSRGFFFVLGFFCCCLAFLAYSTLLTNQAAGGELLLREDFQPTPVGGQNEPTIATPSTTTAVSPPVPQLEVVQPPVTAPAQPAAPAVFLPPAEPTPVVEIVQPVPTPPSAHAQEEKPAPAKELEDIPSPNAPQQQQPLETPTLTPVEAKPVDAPVVQPIEPPQSIETPIEKPVEQVKAEPAAQPVATPPPPPAAIQPVEPPVETAKPADVKQPDPKWSRPSPLADGLPGSASEREWAVPAKDPPPPAVKPEDFPEPTVCKKGEEWTENEERDAVFREKHSCLVPRRTDHIPMLYQLAYDFDQVWNEFQIPYSIEDGTLLGAMRHGGIIPWDDDIDVMCACDIDAPCWKLMFDINSPLHSALATRGLAMHIGSPDDHRHMLKVYSRHQFIAHQIRDWYTFPNLDVFLSKPIRCNVSANIDSSEWYEVSLNKEQTSIEHPEAREKKSKELQIYETDIWAYHSYPDRFRHGCNVLDQTFNHQIMSEIYPQKRYKFGPIELWGPNDGAAVLTRAMGRLWKSHLHRSSESHMLGDAREDERAAELESIRNSKPFEPCHLDTILMAPDERAWATRPATPMNMVRDEERKDKNERKI